jgi:signal transduction histidine kinase
LVFPKRTRGETPKVRGAEIAAARYSATLRRGLLRVTVPSGKLALIELGQEMSRFAGARMRPIDEDRDASPRSSAILIVDDIHANLFALETALAVLERPIVQARSGTEALAQLLKHDIALVLLDVQMPDMDGYETARWIRSTQRTRDLPIIFLTAHDRNDQSVKRAYQLGVVDFLFKPLDTEILCAKARVFITLHERSQELARLQARRLLDEQREEFLRREVAVEQRANAELALADRRKTEFLATLAHELRSPLAPIRSCVDVLRGAPYAAPPKKVVDVLDRQVTSVTRLVDDMLDISRIVAGKLTIRSELLELGMVIEHAITECNVAIAERSHTLTVRGPDELIPVHGDALRLVQIIVNLLTNAVRYTRPKGSIELTWGRREAVAYVRVTDDGIGMQPERIEGLFEMFAQEGIAGEAGGLGLGLALAKRLIELHGGAIRASSDGRDRGSTFEITIPVAERNVVDESRPSRTEAKGGSRPKTRRVLVVDDNEDTRELMAALLLSHGHRVVTAHDGPSALAALCDRTHDIALVDIGLPGFDGIELVRLARERHPSLSTKLVAITGYGGEGDRQRTAVAGFDAHLVKPVASTDVIEVIDVLCASSLNTTC